jgi:uroporphyrinogen decarboxylase
MGKLNSKERALIAFTHKEPDRVPLDYAYNPGIDHRLKQYYGLKENDDEGLLQALNVDFRYVYGPPYIGPKLHPVIPDRQVDIWGIRTRYIEHEYGGYWEYCDFPLKDATLELVEAWPMPSPDDFDYAQFVEQCKQYKEYCLVVGGQDIPDIINSTGFLFTMEQTLINLAMENPVFIRYVERRHAVQFEVFNRALEAVKGIADLFYMGEDLGTQRGPTISLKMYRKLIRPWHEQFVNLAKNYNLPVMIHSCGSSSWAFEDFIAMGIDAVDTLQPEVKDMSPAYLKQCFGDRLSFHGCISTAGPLVYGTVKEVEQNVREILEIMMPGGGYALAPTHQLQDNTPTENVVAMYEAAQKYGRY